MIELVRCIAHVVLVGAKALLDKHPMGDFLGRSFLAYRGLCGGSLLTRFTNTHFFRKYCLSRRIK